MMIFPSGNGFGTKSLFRKGLAFFLFACIPLTLAFSDVPKFYGNGGAGTVIEINGNTLAGCKDAAQAEKALTCIVRSITTYSNIQFVDRRTPSAPKGQEETLGGRKGCFVLAIEEQPAENGERSYLVDCRIKNPAQKTDVAGFVRKNVPASEVESMQIFRVASQYLLQSLHVILTPAARKEILSE